MPSEPQQSGERIAFDPFEVEMTSGELYKKGRKIRLGKQPADLLVLLVRRRGTLVSREELRCALWPGDTFVDFNHGLNNCIRRIREALGDSVESPRFIETLPKKGYRFIPETRLLTSPQQPLIQASIAAEQTRPEPVATPFTMRTKSRWATAGWISLIGLGLVVMAVTFASFRKLRPKIDGASQHVASHVHGLTLSRDGKLIGYVAAAGEYPHIWVRHTAGETAIQVTSGPQPDMAPDLSPDGAKLAFVSARGEGGIYIVPSFGGEPKLIARGGLNPKFSPDSTKVLYWDNRQRPLIVSVGGGSPGQVTLAKGIQVLSTPLWSPAGKEVIFYGARKIVAGESRGWWIAPLSGGEVRPAHFPNVEQHRGLFPAVRDWYRAKDGREWILYGVDSGDRWSLFRIESFASGAFGSKAELLASGEGQLGAQSRLSEDGKLAYNTLALGGLIYQIATDTHGRKAESTLRFALPEELNCHSPAISRDGRWMVYTTSTPAKANRALLRDLTTGTERLLDDGVSGPDGGKNTISPDGSLIIVGRKCQQGSCAFLLRQIGGEPEKLCDACIARGFSSNGTVVLIETGATASKGQDKIATLNLATKQQRDFLSDPDHPLYQPSFSWDDRWVVFKRQFVGTSQIMMASVREGAAGRAETWTELTDGRYVDDKPRFSPDGESIYFLSSRDGHTCIWNQKLDPKTKHPVGPPTVYEHFHHLSFDFFRLGRTELSVARGKIVTSIPEVRSDLWIKQVD